MRERRTARVLLFDPEGRLLLMKGRFPGRPLGSGAWFTVGGGLREGEMLDEAARREVLEETGITAMDLGPVVWLREAAYELFGEPVLFRESYFVAHCAAIEPVRDGWDEGERELMEDIRWWRLPDLRRCLDPIYPEGLCDLAPDIAGGRYPARPLIITPARASDGQGR